MNTLGVGIAFNPALAEFVAAQRDKLDFLEISPERFWNDRGPAWKESPDRYKELPEAVSQFEAARGDLPLVAHGVGLSIATAGPLDLGHVKQIAHWHKRYDFTWISEHLAYFRLGPDYDWRGIGIMLPPNYEEATLIDLEDKVQQISDVIETDFLLENAVNYTPVTNPEFNEADFLFAVASRTKAKLLLDLHNLHTNAINHGWDPISAIDSLDLMQVQEVHIAGGEPLAGQWTDAHSGRCPPEVWSLLNYVLSRPNGVQAITYEVDESYATQMDDNILLEEIFKAQEVWDLTRT